MCTVTYLPTGHDEFLFTSNRDEAPNRSASLLQMEERSGKKLLYPQDSLAKGTWIATANHNQLVCILNGAYTLHRHQPPYRLSRGIMALEFFTYQDARHFAKEFEFEGMEPFTMVIYDRGQLIDLRWDEEQLLFTELDAQQPHLWASATLYDAIQQEKRHRWFAEWLSQHQSYRSEDILHFHHTAGDGDPTSDIIMNRMNRVRTTSITHIVKTKDRSHLQYEPLLNGQIRKQELELITS